MTMASKFVTPAAAVLIKPAFGSATPLTVNAPVAEGATFVLPLILLVTPVMVFVPVDVVIELLPLVVCITLLPLVDVIVLLPVDDVIVFETPVWVFVPVVLPIVVFEPAVDERTVVPVVVKRSFTNTAPPLRPPELLSAFWKSTTLLNHVEPSTRWLPTK